MDISTKEFKELQTGELYEILQLRAAVFVVEQQCPYQDLDGKDQVAFHVMGYKGKTLVAYTRIFKPGDYAQMACIGRVVVSKDERKYGYGKDIMNASIGVIHQHFKMADIEISAQLYLTKFYNSLGFTEVGSTYMEDDIPHIRMVRTKKSH
jgi:ElaA protein